MLSQHVDALPARRGYQRSLSADARYGGIVDALSSELTLQRAPWTALALANSPWLWSPLRPFSRRWSPRSLLVCHRAPLRVPAPFTNSLEFTTHYHWSQLIGHSYSNSLGMVTIRAIRTIGVTTRHDLSAIRSPNLSAAISMSKRLNSDDKTGDHPLLGIRHCRHPPEGTALG